MKELDDIEVRTAPLPYIDDKVPISWLNFYDELHKISAKKVEEDHGDGDEDPYPFLATGLTPVASGQDTDLPAFSIARDCKVFEVLESLEDQKHRIGVVLNALNEVRGERADL